MRIEKSKLNYYLLNKSLCINLEERKYHSTKSFFIFSSATAAPPFCLLFSMHQDSLKQFNKKGDMN